MYNKVSKHPKRRKSKYTVFVAVTNSFLLSVGNSGVFLDGIPAFCDSGDADVCIALNKRLTQEKCLI